MRQIFSIRFLAAVGAVVGLFFLLTTFFATREAIEGGGDADGGVFRHRIDFVDQVASSTNPFFRLDEDGLVASDADLVIDEQRRLRLVAGTPGELYCDVLDPRASCAIVADLLGEAVVWFAFVPMGERGVVPFPAIDVLDDGRAVLVNGWDLPYASVLDRRCEDARGNDVEFASYREFREAMGDDFTSLYSIEDRRLAAVECHTRVPYAPEPELEPELDSPAGSAPTTAPG